MSSIQEHFTQGFFYNIKFNDHHMPAHFSVQNEKFVDFVVMSDRKHMNPEDHQKMVFVVRLMDVHPQLFPENHSDSRPIPTSPLVMLSIENKRLNSTLDQDIKFDFDQRLPIIKRLFVSGAISFKDPKIFRREFPKMGDEKDHSSFTEGYHPYVKVGSINLPTGVHNVVFPIQSHQKGSGSKPHKTLEVELLGDYQCFTEKSYAVIGQMMLVKEPTDTREYQKEYQNEVLTNTTLFVVNNKVIADTTDTDSYRLFESLALLLSGSDKKNYGRILALRQHVFNVVVN